MLIMRFETQGFRDVQGRFAKRSERLAEMQRDLARKEGRAMVGLLREMAPKKSSKFAQGIHYRTTPFEGGTTVTIYVRGEHAHLLRFLVEGTHAHLIPRGGSAEQMAKGYPLRFYWEKGPRGPGVYYFWSVRHPGFEPKFLVAKAIERRLPEMRKSLQGVARRIAYTGGL